MNIDTMLCEGAFSGDSCDRVATYIGYEPETREQYGDDESIFVCETHKDMRDKTLGWPNNFEIHGIDPATFVKQEGST